MQSRRSNRSAKRSRWAWNNSPAGLRNRRAKADARREAIAALLPPAPEQPQPLSVWQRFDVQLLVPAEGRCDQFAVLINGERVGIVSATELGREVAKRVRKRASVALLADMRRELFLGV